MPFGVLSTRYSLSSSQDEEELRLPMPIGLLVPAASTSLRDSEFGAIFCPIPSSLSESGRVLEFSFCRDPPVSRSETHRARFSQISHRPIGAAPWGASAAFRLRRVINVGEPFRSNRDRASPRTRQMQAPRDDMMMEILLDEKDMRTFGGRDLMPSFAAESLCNASVHVSDMEAWTTSDTNMVRLAPATLRVCARARA